MTDEIHEYLQELIGEWSNHQPEGFDTSELGEGYKRGLQHCADELEELITDE